MTKRNNRIRLASLALAGLWAFLLVSDQHALHTDIGPQVSLFTALSLVEPVTETRERRIKGDTAYDDVDKRATTRLDTISIESPRHLEADVQLAKDYNSSMSIVEKRAFCDSKTAFWTLQVSKNGTLSPNQCSQMKDTCGVTSCDASVDLVYLWVNGSDPAFQQKKKATLKTMERSKDHGYSKRKMKLGLSVSRFRDLDELRHSLRSVHRNAPWARRIFIVTDDQTPACVEDEAEDPNLRLRTRVVSHQDLFSYVKVDKPKYPLYNSKAIQYMVHAIPTLSSPFMMMDDDFFFGRPIPRSYIFDPNDGNKAILHVHNRKVNYRRGNEYGEYVFNAIKLIGSKFPNSAEVADVVQSKTYTLHEHGPILLHPQDGFRLWELFPDQMRAEVNRPLRHSKSANVQTLYRFLSIAETDRYSSQPSGPEFRFVKNRDTSYAKNMKLLRKQRNKLPYMLCLNDDLGAKNREAAANSIQESLGVIFPSILS